METTSGDVTSIRRNSLCHDHDLGYFPPFIVNLVFLAAEVRETELYSNELQAPPRNLSEWNRLGIRHDYDHQFNSKQILRHLKDRHSCEWSQFYSMYKEERGYFNRRNTLEKSRKLVIFRQMNVDSQKGRLRR